MILKREIITTGDGSTTIHLPQWDEHYHSKHGAINEARHVFIKMGLLKALEKDLKEVAILEIGFGTGLNALVTWETAGPSNTSIFYTGIEAYPVPEEEVLQLNFAVELGKKNATEFFSDLHNLPWEVPGRITPSFMLTKQQKFFQDIEDKNMYNLVYFDAFGARVQPDLWTEDIFKKMYDALKPGGILVTYAAKGSVRRAMQQVGFLVEKLPGPPGKREMLRASR